MSPGGHGGGGYGGGWGPAGGGPPGGPAAAGGGWGAGHPGPGQPYGPHVGVPHGGVPHGGGMPHGSMPGHHGSFGMVHGGHGSHHEFGVAENATIGSAATWAKALGVVGFVDVGLEALNLNIIGAAIALAIALAFWKAGSSLSSVVTTQGHDVPHLMHAVQQIGSAFHTRTIVTLIGAGLLLLVGVGMAVLAIVVATR